MKSGIHSFARNPYGIIFFSCLTYFFLVLAWHIWGPISGTYDFISAYRLLIQEFNNPWAWPLCLIAVLASMLRNESSRDGWKNHFSNLRFDRRLVFSLLSLPVILLILQTSCGFLQTLCLLVLLFMALSHSGYLKILSRVCYGIAGYLLVSYAFTMVKLSAFMGRAPWDAALLRMDQILGFGWIRDHIIKFSHEHEILIYLANESYQMIFPIAGMFALAASLHGKQIFFRYVASLFLVKSMGAFSYLLFPAWGPFTQHEFLSLAPSWKYSHWRVALIQDSIHSNSMKIVSGEYNLGNISPFAFVSAMPSLHVAIPVVALLVFWRNSPAVKYLALAMVAVSAYSAIVTGMHYIIDLVAGFLLASLAVYVSGKWLYYDPENGANQETQGVPSTASE